LAYEIVKPGFNFETLLSLAPMLLTILATLTDTRAFGSFCCQ
jgi:hypothetical protein